MKILLLHHYGIALNILVRLIFLFSVMIGVMLSEDEDKLNLSTNLTIIGIFMCIVLGIVTKSFIEFIQAIILFLAGIFLVCFIETLFQTVADQRVNKRKSRKNLGIKYDKEKIEDTDIVSDEYIGDGYLAYQYLASENEYDEEDSLGEYNEDEYYEDDLDEYNENEYDED